MQFFELFYQRYDCNNSNAQDVHISIIFCQSADIFGSKVRMNINVFFNLECRINIIFLHSKPNYFWWRSIHLNGANIVDISFSNHFSWYLFLLHFFYLYQSWRFVLCAVQAFVSCCIFVFSSVLVLLSWENYYVSFCLSFDTIERLFVKNLKLKFLRIFFYYILELMRE